MNCPRDGHPLGADVLDGVPVARCAACGGTWIAETDLDAVVTSADDLPRPTDLDRVAAAFDMSEDTALPPVQCPRCGAEAVREEALLASQVLVDACPVGHGLWLDAGELERLERFLGDERRGARDLVGRAWRELRDWETGRS